MTTSARRAHAAGAHLPARSIAEIQLAGDVAGGACPLCATRDRAVSRYVDALLSEGVNDPALRASFDRARGFCPEHTNRLLDADRSLTGGALGSAILLAATMRTRIDELESAAAAGRARSRRLAEAAQPPACPLCITAADAEGRASVGLLARGADPAWSAALSSAPFCLPHLARTWALADTAGRAIRDAWQPVGERQLVRLRAIQALADDFAHNSAFDRRQALTPEQLASPGLAAEALAGSRPAAERR